MADNVSLTIKAAGVAESGTLQPQAGAVVSVEISDAAKAKFAVDYSGPDEIRLSLLGDFVVVTDRLSLSPGLSTNLLDGSTRISGAAEWTINKNTSVVIESSFDTHGGAQMGATLTLRF